MWPRIGAALALLCALATAAAAQVPVRKDGAGQEKASNAAPRLLGTPLPPPGMPVLLVFDTAKRLETRRALIAGAPALPDSVRDALLLRALRLDGDRAGDYVAGIAVMTAVRLGEPGRALLRAARQDSLVTSPRTRAAIEAALHPR